MANARVSILLDAKDRASREIRQAEGALGKLRATGRSAAIAITALTAAVVGGAVAFDRMAQRGGKVANLQRTFTRIFGEQEAAIGRMRQATLGLVSDYELMRQANTAIALGSARNAEEFSTLAETASTLGRALGLDVGFALNSLNIGIARQSRLVLDNVGVIVSVEKANEDYAAALGVTVDQLTDAQRQEAFRIAVMESARQKIEEVGGAALNNADNIERLKVAFGNALDAASEWVATSPAIAAAMDNIGDAAKRLSDNLAGVGEEGDSSGRMLARVFSILDREITGGLLGKVLERARQMRGGGTIGDPIPIRSPRPAAPTFDFADPGHPGRPSLAMPGIPGVTMPGFGPFGITAPGAVQGAVRGELSHGLTAPMPGQITGTARAIAESPTLPGLNKVEDAAMNANAALMAGVGAFQAIAMAAIRGGEEIEDVLIPSILNIAAAGIGGPFGAAIGALGGIAGALLSGNDRPRVVVDEYGSRAERTMRDINQDVVRDVFINGQAATDEQIRQLGYRQGRIARLRGESPTGV